MENNYQMEKLFEVFQIQKYDVKRMKEVLESTDLTDEDRIKLETIFNSMNSLLRRSKKALVIMNVDIVVNFLRNLGERSLTNNELFEIVVKEALIPAVEDYNPNMENKKGFITFTLPYIGYSVAKWEKENAAIATVNQSELDRLEKFYLTNKREIIEIDEEFANEVIDYIYEKGIHQKVKSLNSFKRTRKN